MPGAPRETDNPLEPLAALLIDLNSRLRDDEGRRSPRWARLARARAIREKPPFGPVVARGVGLVLDFACGLQHLTFEAEDLLLHVDPTNALLELVLRSAEALVDPKVGEALTALLVTEAPARALQDAARALREARGALRFVPRPRDLNRLGQELYRLLGIPGLAAPPTDALLPPAGVGPLRLLSWAFAHPTLVRHRTAGGLVRRVPVTTLGCGFIGSDTVGRGEFLAEIGDFTIFEVRERRDLIEVNALLEALGYSDPPNPDRGSLTPALSRRLELFQRFNDLPLSGEPDVHTVHRLLNLDFASRSVAPAQPFDPKELRALRPRPTLDEEGLQVRALGGWIPLPVREWGVLRREELGEEGESPWIHHECEDTLAVIQEKPGWLFCPEFRMQEDGEGRYLASRALAGGPAESLAGVFRWLTPHERMRELPPRTQLRLSAQALLRHPQGTLREQGRIFLAVVGPEAFAAGPQAPLSDAHILACAWSGWWPDRLADVELWSPRRTPALTLASGLPEGAGLLVGLYGIKLSEEPSAVHFKEVMVRWDLVHTGPEVDDA